MTFSKIKSLIYCSKQEIKVERLYMKGILSICHPFSNFLLVEAIENVVNDPKRKYAIVFDSPFMCRSSNLNRDKDAYHYANCGSMISPSFCMRRT